MPEGADDKPPVSPTTCRHDWHTLSHWPLQRDLQPLDPSTRRCGDRFFQAAPAGKLAVVLDTKPQGHMIARRDSSICVDTCYREAKALSRTHKMCSLTYTHTHTHIHSHTHTHSLSLFHTYTIYLCVCVYICIHTHTHTCVCVCIHMSGGPSTLRS